MTSTAYAIELALDARAQLGEGPCWSVEDQSLYWVDIFAATVHAFHPGTNRSRTWRLDALAGCVVPRRSGGLLLAYQDGFAALDPESGRIDPWMDPEGDRPLNRLNDGKCDARGRLWAGSKSGSTPADGGLFRLDGRGTCERLLSGVGVSNGLAWSADGRDFYYIDTILESVRHFRCDPDTGTIRDPRVVITLPHAEHGWADGMCIDVEGMLWIAHYGGGMVSRWDPRTGRRITVVTLPVANVTSCTFGGARLDQLYITTARAGLDERGLTDQPQAGGLFVASVGTSGPPATPFAG